MGDPRPAQGRPQHHCAGCQRVEDSFDCSIPSVRRDDHRLVARRQRLCLCSGRVPGGRQVLAAHCVARLSQGESFIGDVFYMNSGYWQWAKNNNIVLLFPQAESNPLLENPIGCFDWWGYTDGNYAFKSGIQMTTVRNMAMYLGAQK